MSIQGNKIIFPEDIREEQFTNHIEDMARKQKKSLEEQAKIDALRKLTGFYGGESFETYVPDEEEPGE